MHENIPLGFVFGNSGCNFLVGVLLKVPFCYWMSRKVLDYQNLCLLLLFFIKFLSFHQMIALQNLWKMFFISSKKLFSFLRYSIFCNFPPSFLYFPDSKGQMKVEWFMMSWAGLHKFAVVIFGITGKLLYIPPLNLVR